MKKVLATLLVLVAVGIALPWGRAYLDLQKLNKGQIYTWSLMTIEIPKDSAALKGFLKPYIEIRNTRIDVHKVDASFTLPVAHLKARGWSREHLSLEVPEFYDAKTGTEWKNAKILFLKTKKTFEGFETDEVSLLPKRKGPESAMEEPSSPVSIHRGEKGNAAIHGLKFSIDSGSGVLPDHMTIKIGDVTMAPKASEIAADPSQKDEHLAFRDLLFDLKTSLQSNRRSWNVQLGGKGDFQIKNVPGTIEPWDISMSGDMNDFSHADLAAFQKKMSEAIATMKSPLNSPAPSIDCVPNVDNPEADPNCPPPADVAASDLTKERFRQLLTTFFDFLEKIDVQPIAQRTEWKGMQIQDKDGQLVIEPIHGEAHWKYQENSFSQESRFSVKKISGGTKKVNVNALLEDLNFVQKMDYQIDYRTMRRKQFAYYQSSFEKGFDKGLSKSSSPYGFLEVLPVLSGFIGQLPDTTNGELTLRLLKYEGMGIKGEHKDMKAGVVFTNDRLQLTLANHFSHEDQSRKDMEFKDASATFETELQIPWTKILGQIRQGALLGILDTIYNENAGLKIKTALHLGVNWPQIDLLLDVATFIPKPPPPPSMPSMSSWPEGDAPHEEAMQAQMEASMKYQEKVRSEMLKAFTEKGRLNFNLAVERFSKLKALIEKEDPQFEQKFKSAENYYKLDTAADRLSSQIEMKGKAIWVNGVVDPILSAVINPASLPETPPPPSPAPR